MLKQRRWPFPSDTPLDRARTLARALWAALNTHNPEQAAQFLDAAGPEAVWLAPAHRAPGEGRWLTRDQVALLGGVQPPVVSNWGSRGLSRRGERRTLTRHPEGWHPDEVHEFLAWRDQPTPPLPQ